MELKLDNVTKKFDSFKAVSKMTLTMTNGVYGLLGINGAGKTTLMRMMCTLMHPTSGTISYNGLDIFSMADSYRNIIGYLPQDFGFYPDFTCRDYLMYIAALKGIRTALAKKRVKELLDAVGLSKAVSKKMRNLSGGMKRRVGIAQAMLNDPKILILDEPTAGLDPMERIRFRNLIGKLSENRIVLLSTHIVSDIEAIANHIFLMKDGKLLKSGTVKELCDDISDSVWICNIKEDKVNDLMEKYQIVNMKGDGITSEVRVLAPVIPIEGAKKVENTLEDVFLYYFGKQGRDEDAEIRTEQDI